MEKFIQIDPQKLERNGVINMNDNEIDVLGIFVVQDIDFFSRGHLCFKPPFIAVT